MKKIILVFLMAITLSCNNSSSNNLNYSTPENSLEAARQFIEITKHGKYDDAKLMIANSVSNDSILNIIEKGYKLMSPGQKQDLQNASINIHNIEDINEKTSIINYSTTFDKKVRKLKVINQEGKWLIDIGYTFNGNL